VLIVEDDKFVARTLARALPPALDVRHAATRASALRVLEAPLDLKLALLDVRLGPHAYGGLDVLDRIASDRSEIVTAIFTGLRRAEVINHASERGAVVLAKPLDGRARSALGRLVARALAPSAAETARDAVAGCVEEHARRWRLSPKETLVLTEFVRGKRHHEIASSLGVAMTSVRTFVHRILAKAGAFASMMELVVHLVGSASRAGDRP
jgi:FixJ family two-component response regulator